MTDTTLAPDTAAFKAGLSTLQGNTTLNSELRTFAETDYSLQTSIPGVIIDTISVDVYNALIAIQNNSKSFIALNVFGSVVSAITSFSDVFEAQSGAMIDILTAAQKGPLTAKQVADFKASLTTLTTALSTQTECLSAKQALTKSLSDVIDAPDGELDKGVITIQSKLTYLNTQLNDLEGMENVPGADNASLGAGILGYQTGITALTNLLASVQNLKTVDSQMETALANLLTVWQTLVGKYQYVAAKLDDSSQITSILSVGDVKSAQAGWMELKTYASSL